MLEPARLMHPVALLALGLAGACYSDPSFGVAQLTVTAIPQQISGRGRASLVSVETRDSRGRPGTGEVTLTASAGIFSDGAKQTSLRLANGSAGIGFGYACTASADRQCANEVRIDARWGQVNYSVMLLVGDPSFDGDPGDFSVGYLSLSASRPPLIFYNVGHYSTVTAQLSADAGRIVGQTIGFSANVSGFNLPDGGIGSMVSSVTGIDGKALAQFRDDGVAGAAAIVATHVPTRSIAVMTLPLVGAKQPNSDFNIDVSSWPVAVATSDTASSAEMIHNINTADDAEGHESTRAWLTVGLFGDPFPYDRGPGPYMNYEAKMIIAVGGNQPGVTVNIHQYPAQSDGVDHSSGAMIPRFWPIPPNVITEVRSIQGGWPGNDVYLDIPAGSLRREGSRVEATSSTPCFFTPGQVVTLSPGESDFPAGPKTIHSATPSGFSYIEDGTGGAASTNTARFSLRRPADEGDRHLQIYDFEHNAVYEMWHAHFGWPVEDMWNAGAGAVFNLTTRTHARPSCSNPNHCLGWSSADASGLPMSPGHLLYDEVFTLPEEIDHGFSTAIGIIRRSPRAGDSWTQAYVWPASHTDGTGVHRDCPPMGTRLRLKPADAIINVGGPDITDPGLYTLAQQKFLRALQTYGFIIADTLGGAADSLTMSGIYDERWNQIGSETGRLTMAQEWYAKFRGDRSVFPMAVPFLVDYFDVLQPGCGAPGSSCP